MATLCIRTGKTPGYEIRFWNTRGNRRETIYLGGRKYSEKTANELKAVIETLVYCRDNSIPMLDKRTLAWIDSACSEIREKLAKAGLIEIPQSYTLKELWDTFLNQKTGIKDSTQTTYENARRRFFEFFKESELLENLTQPQLQKWKESLRETLAEATTAGTITKVKAVFNWAVEKGWVQNNPLDGIGRGSFVNKEKDRFITMDEYRRLLDACPCRDWRVIIALARIGGLRCPSEVLRLRWEDMNWEYSRFLVKSPKTERYQGKESRLVPIFPELRTELEALFFDSKSEGKEYVINRYRDPERTNLGTQFARIAKMAGVKPIQRPFDNMRASRSTEVYADFGAFLESQWIGHSSKTAKDHYLQVREIDFERAAGKVGIENSHHQKEGFPPVEKALPTTIPTSRGSQQLAKNRNAPKEKDRQTLNLPVFATPCD